MVHKIAGFYFFEKEAIQIKYYKKDEYAEIS